MGPEKVPDANKGNRGKDPCGWGICAFWDKDVKILQRAGPGLGRNVCVILDYPSSSSFRISWSCSLHSKISPQMGGCGGLSVDYTWSQARKVQSNGLNSSFGFSKKWKIGCLWSNNEPIATNFDVTATTKRHCKVGPYHNPAIHPSRPAPTTTTLLQCKY